MQFDLSTGRQARALAAPRRCYARAVQPQAVSTGSGILFRKQSSLENCRERVGHLARHMLAICSGGWTDSCKYVTIQFENSSCAMDTVIFRWRIACSGRAVEGWGVCVVSCVMAGRATAPLLCCAVAVLCAPPRTSRLGCVDTRSRSVDVLLPSQRYKSLAETFNISAGVQHSMTIPP